MNKNNIEFLENLLATFNNEDLKKNINEILNFMKEAEEKKEAEALAIVEKKPKAFETIIKIVRDFFYDIEIESLDDVDLNEESKRELDQYMRNKLDDSYQYTIALDNYKINHWEYTVSFYLDECPCGNILHLAIENYRPDTKFKALGAPHEIFYIMIDFDKEGAIRKVDTLTNNSIRFNGWAYIIYSHEIKHLLSKLMYEIMDSNISPNQKMDCEELLKLHI